MNEQTKELAKKLCAGSSCHHKCPDTDKYVVEEEAELLINENKSNNFDVKSNNELFKQALVEGINRRIDRDIEEAKKIEQIEKMAKHCPCYFGEKCCIDGELPERCDMLCQFGTYAEILYNAGYRKQSEGKWGIIKIGDGEKVRTCTNCYISQSVNVYNGKVMFNYCPYCGASMKGGE